jgi:hypothetical protein
MCCGREAAGSEATLIEEASLRRNQAAFTTAIASHCDNVKADETKRLADLHNSGTLRECEVKSLRLL